MKKTKNYYQTKGQKQKDYKNIYRNLSEVEETKKRNYANIRKKICQTQI